jgi:hypothetical protein
MSSIELENLQEVLDGISKKAEEMRAARFKAATQMGITAKQNIQDQTPDPMHVKTGAWQRSWGSQVNEVSEETTEVVVSSDGAERYYHIQEALHHPGAIGWHKSIPELDEIYKQNMSLK